MEKLYEFYGIKQGEVGEKLLAAEVVQGEVIPNFSPTSSQLLPYFSPTSSKNGENVNDYSGLPSLTERNRTEQNNTGVELLPSGEVATSPSASQCQLASPSDDVAASQPHERNARSLPLASHVPHLAMEVRRGQLSSATEEMTQRIMRQHAERRNTPAPAQDVNLKPEPVARHYNENGVTEANALLIAAMRAEAAEKAQQERALVMGMTPTIRMKNPRFEYSLWQRDGGLTGEIRLSGSKYFLQFGDWGSVETRMGPSQYNRTDLAWWNQFVTHELSDLFAAFRNGQRGHEYRLAVSPLLTTPYKDASVVSPNAVVRAVWQGDTLVRLDLINGTDRYEIPVKPFTGKNDSSPDYKG